MSKLGLNGTSSSSVLGKVKVTSTDNAEYLVEKISSDGTIDVTQQTDSDGNQYLELSLNESYATVDTYKVKKDGADVTPDFLVTKLTEVFTAGDVLPDFLLAGTGIDLSAPAAGVITFSLDADINDLGDVLTSLVSDRNILSYDSGSAKWVNTDVSWKNSGLAWTEVNVLPTADAVDDFVVNEDHSTSGDWSFTGIHTLSGKRVHTPVEVATTPYTITTNNTFFVTDSSSIVITLPSSPTNGQIYTIMRLSSGTGYITVSGGASTIDNSSSTYFIPFWNQSVQFIYESGDDTWRILSNTYTSIAQNIDATSAPQVMSPQKDVVKITTHASVTQDITLPLGAYLNGWEVYNCFRVAGNASVSLVTADSATIIGVAAGTPVSFSSTFLYVTYDKVSDNWIVDSR